MNYLEKTGGYESMIWVNDRNGREFSCYVDDMKKVEHFEDLPEELRAQCLDVNELIGTERW